jgi:nucleotide-binding universal stress UspA family protein
MGNLFTHILVPTDFGESSGRALALAVSLAQKYGAKITLVHSYEVPAVTYASQVAAVDFLTPVREAAEAQLDRALVELRKQLPEAAGMLCFGRPWQEILQAIDETHADLVVMGTHGRHGVAHALLGSVAEKIVRASPSPVLTVR